MPMFWAEGAASVETVRQDGDLVCRGLEGKGGQCPWKSERGGEWQQMSSESCGA